MKIMQFKIEGKSKPREPSFSPDDYDSDCEEVAPEPAQASVAAPDSAPPSEAGQQSSPHAGAGDRTTPERGSGTPPPDPWMTVGRLPGEDLRYGGVESSPEAESVPPQEVRGPIPGRKINPLVRKRLNSPQKDMVAVVESSENAQSSTTARHVPSTESPSGASVAADGGPPDDREILLQTLVSQ